MADIPTGICPTDSSFHIVWNTQSYVSPLTRSTQTASLDGDPWVDVVSFGPLVDLPARQYKAWLNGLKGMVGRFNYSPPDLNQQGVGTAAITVDGASQTGESLDIQTTDLNTLLFGIGDYLQVNGELKTVQADVTSDGSGLATVTFVPPLRQSPADLAVVEYEDPRAIMRLEDNDQGQSSITSPIIYNSTISIVEAF